MIRARTHVRKIENNNINTELFFFCVFVVVVVISLFVRCCLLLKKRRIKEEEMWKVWNFFVVQNNFCKTVGVEVVSTFDPPGKCRQDWYYFVTTEKAKKETTFRSIKTLHSFSLAHQHTHTHTQQQQQPAFVFTLRDRFCWYRCSCFWCRAQIGRALRDT